MSNKQIVSLKQQIQPAFLPAIQALESGNYNELIMTGGRSSFKSTFAYTYLVHAFMQDKDANILLLRNTYSSLENSVYTGIKKAIERLKLEPYFTFYKKPLRITHKRWGTSFLFEAAGSDVEKLKSYEVDTYITHIFFEELTQFSKKTKNSNGLADLDTILDSFIRQKLPPLNGKERNIKILYAFNPRPSVYDDTNVWLRKKLVDPKVYHLHTTYLDDYHGFIADIMVDKIEMVKEVDPDYYDNLYLGKITGMSDSVYTINNKTFNRIDEQTANEKGLNMLGNDDPIIYLGFSTDTGYSVSASVTLAFGITRKGNLILLNTYRYSNKEENILKGPSEIAKDIKEFRNSVMKQYKKYDPLVHVADSADSGIRAEAINGQGFTMTPVSKDTKMVMIDSVIDLFSKQRFYYVTNKNNEIVREEHAKYSYDPSSIKLGNDDLIRVIKRDDDTVDALQYFVHHNKELIWQLIRIDDMRNGR